MKKKEILLWLEDAVEIKAQSKKIDAWKSLLGVTVVKIQINFSFEGKNYAHVSLGKTLGIPNEGYHAVWAKYVDRKINILYSSKYDQVLILKDKKQT